MNLGRKATFGREVNKSKHKSFYTRRMHGVPQTSVNSEVLLSDRRKVIFHPRCFHARTAPAKGFYWKLLIFVSTRRPWDE